jgi:hypothetical protein
VRTGAYYNELDGYDCTYYLSQTTLPSQDVATVCAGYNFSNPAELTPWLEAIWYGGDYKTNIMTISGMTEAQYTDYYDVTK